MVKTPTNSVLQFLKRLAEDPRLKECADHDLLQRFIAQGDEAAFAVLIRRYGRTVFSVCRYILPCDADAEDAFQATFLVLARKAESIRKGEPVGSWLYGVAYKTALKARANAANRRSHEARAPVPSASSPTDDLSWREIQAVLHEELSRLPGEYRAAIVLCFLESRTLDDAATQLGCGKGALRGRLERARHLLQSRLTRRGVGPMVLVVAWAVSGPASANLVSSTAKAAATVAAGYAATSVVSAKVTALTEGVMKAMFVTKLKIALASFLLAAASIGAAVMMVQAGTGSPNDQNPLPKFFAVPDREDKRPSNAEGSKAEAEVKADDPKPKPEAQEPAAKKDKDALQGEWKVVGVLMIGKADPKQEAQVKGKTVVFKGNKVIIMQGECDLTLDPSKTPKEMDFLPTEGPEGEKGKIWRAIYELKGDDLKIGYDGPDQPRPKNFDEPGRPGAPNLGMLLKRVAPKGGGGEEKAK
jgi:RNA polymerase sigma factor (sigma-70 family)